MIEIKLAQGAKPGKGGILPAAKVTREIAEIRGIKAGEASISPNRYTEIDNVEELLDFIEHVRAVSKLRLDSRQCLAPMAGSINYAMRSKGAALKRRRISSL